MKLPLSRRTLLQLPVLGLLGTGLSAARTGAATAAAADPSPRLDLLAAAPPDEPEAPAASVSDTEWRHYAADLANTRYLPLSQINADNFNDLEVAWRFNTLPFGPIPEYQFESTPLLANGRLFTTAGSRRDVVALDPGTGEVLWVHREDEGERAAHSPRRLSGRGVEYWTDGHEERIYYVTIGYQLVALDARTGERVSRFGQNGIVDLRLNDDQFIDPVTGDIGLHSTPVIAGEVVIVGAAHSAGNFPRVHRNVVGYVRGFDLHTGQRRWIFHTIPKRGEAGYETWYHDSAEQNGNTGCWCQISVDEGLGLAYLGIELGTGDEMGMFRPGPNLYSETLVALDFRTGELRWKYQLCHHGLWDRDVPCAPVLCDIPHEGRTLKALAQPSKQGFLYVLDRETGQPVWPITEHKVPRGNVPGEWYSPTQPIPSRPAAYEVQGVTPEVLINFTPELHAEALRLVQNYVTGPLYTPPTLSTEHGKWGTLVAPHLTGGSNWPGASYDPETHIVYVYSKNEADLCGIVPNPDPTRSDFPYVHGVVGFHYHRPGTPPVQGPTIERNGFRPGVLEVDGLPLLAPPYGRITAINLETGDIVWWKPHGDTPDEVKNHPKLKGLDIPRTGRAGQAIGTLTTASLVIAGEAGFVTTPHGRGAMLRAYDKATGADAGAKYMPAPASGAPMTYLHKGQQYIVIAIGGNNHVGELIAFRLPAEGSHEVRLA